MRVERWNRERLGPVNEAKLRQRLELAGYSVVRQTYQPGAALHPHTHQHDRVDAVVSGRMRFVVAGESIVLGPGDSIEIPHGWEHRLEVVGPKAVIALDGVKISV